MQAIQNIDLFGNEIISQLAKQQAATAVIREAIPEPEKKIFIPHVTINPNYLVFWDKSSSGNNYNRAGLSDNDHKGEMSRKSSKRVRTILSWFTELTKDKNHTIEKKNIKYRLTFATLTLPSPQQFDAGHTDEYIKRHMLNRFFVEAKRKWSIINYLWRAEAQENGNIHFHITFDKFVWHVDLRNLWNSILRDHGYIQAYQARQKEYFKAGFRLSENKHDTRTEQQQREAYERGAAENFTSPNSTDIHSIYKIKNVGGYLAKYVSKNLKVYEIKTEEKLWKVRQVLNKHENFLSVAPIPGGFKVKLSGTDIIDLETFIAKTALKITSVIENVIRAITGRLWYCSRSLRELKNITLELTTEVFAGIAEMLNATPHTERTPMVKNKITNEETPNRFVKVMIGDFLKISKTVFQPKEDNFIIDYVGNWYDAHIRPLLRTITQSIKSFFSTQQEELIQAI